MDIKLHPEDIGTVIHNEAYLAETANNGFIIKNPPKHRSFFSGIWHGLVSLAHDYIKLEIKISEFFIKSGLQVLFGENGTNNIIAFFKQNINRVLISGVLGLGCGIFIYRYIPFMMPAYVTGYLAFFISSDILWGFLINEIQREVDVALLVFNLIFGAFTGVFPPKIAATMLTVSTLFTLAMSIYGENFLSNRPLGYLILDPNLNTQSSECYAYNGFDLSRFQKYLLASLYNNNEISKSKQLAIHEKINDAGIPMVTHVVKKFSWWDILVTGKSNISISYTMKFKDYNISNTDFFPFSIQPQLQLLDYFFKNQPKINSTGYVTFMLLANKYNTYKKRDFSKYTIQEITKDYNDFNNLHIIFQEKLDGRATFSDLKLGQWQHQFSSQQLATMFDIIYDFLHHQYYMNTLPSLEMMYYLLLPGFLILRDTIKSTMERVTINHINNNINTKKYNIIEKQYKILKTTYTKLEVYDMYAATNFDLSFIQYYFLDCLYNQKVLPFTFNDIKGTGQGGDKYYIMGDWVLNVVWLCGKYYNTFTNFGTFFDKKKQQEVANNILLSVKCYVKTLQNMIEAYENYNEPSIMRKHWDFYKTMLSAIYYEESDYFIPRNFKNVNDNEFNVIYLNNLANRFIAVWNKG